MGGRESTEKSPASPISDVFYALSKEIDIDTLQLIRLRFLGMPFYNNSSVIILEVYVTLLLLETAVTLAVIITS